MNFFITTLLIVSCVTTIANCGDYHRIDESTYYTSYPEKKTWNQAKYDCAVKGTLLIDIPTKEENDRILSVIKQTETEYKLDLNDWWTSGTDRNSEGKFYWDTTGAPVVYSSWSTGEPSNGNNEDCIHYNRRTSHKWNDIDCGEELYFICRGEPVEMQPGIDHNNAGSELYRFNGITGTIWLFYMFYAMIQFW